MKKIMLFLTLFALFSIGVTAQTLQEKATVWCAPSVPAEKIEEGMILSYDSSCKCFNWEPIPTEWRNDFCLTGQMVQHRTVDDVLKPFCVERIVRIETQITPNELCRRCEDPESFTDWELVSCTSQGVLKKRTAINACYFDAISGEKIIGNKTQFKLFEGEECFNSQAIFTPAVFILIIIAGGFYFAKKKKIF